MRPQAGYIPAFSSGTRLLSPRPASTMRAYRPKRLRAQRKLVHERRRRLRKTSKKLLKTLAPKSAGMTPEQQLLQRATFGLSLVDLAEIGELGYGAYLDRQLDFEAIDDGGFEEQLQQALPSLAMTPYELVTRYSSDLFQPLVELLLAAIFRAAFSPRQLFERTVLFWSDHFSIDIFANHGFLLKSTDDRDVVRAHALGRFGALLDASAHSPAMLEYLTNDSNVKGHPNENYARELMELHTLGADGPYTQKDVREVARAFTGWTLHDVYDARPEMGTFLFDRSVHDERAKTVLGRQIPKDGGEEDGLRVLEILAGHPKTADFIAYKMARYFWGYEPRRNVVRKVAKRLRSTDGDIRAALKVLLAKKRLKKAQPKLKRPFHLIISALRGTLADVRNPGFLFEHLEIAGHLPFAWSAPNGYPDDPDYWSGFVLPRWNFAAEFPISEESGIGLNPAFLDERRSPKQAVRFLDRQLFNSGMAKRTRTELTDFLSAEPMTRKRLREALGIAVASPEFQLY